MPDDALDIEKPGHLESWLHRHGHLPPDERVRCTILAGGVSNRTMLVDLPGGDALVVKQALAKLRTKVDWFSPVERIHREALGLRWLGEFAPPGTIVGFRFEDFDDHLLGMDAVPQPNENWKTLLLRCELDFSHIEQFGQLLGDIQRQSHGRLGELAPLFDRVYFEPLRLQPYYAYTATQIPAATAFLTNLLAETRSIAQTLVHGDYSPKNVLIQGDQLVLLDHEVIHVGDPGFDLGFSMTHLLSKAHHLPAHRAAFADATNRYWAAYRVAAGDAAWADDIEPRAVRHTLGCMLARVRGTSTLEYMPEDQRARQADAIVALMAEPPATISRLIDRFLDRITAVESTGR